MIAVAGVICLCSMIIITGSIILVALTDRMEKKNESGMEEVNSQ